MFRLSAICNKLIQNLNSAGYLLIKILRLFKLITISKDTLSIINNLSQDRLNDQLYNNYLESVHLPFIDIISTTIDNVDKVKKFLQSLTIQNYLLSHINLYLIVNLEIKNIITIVEEFAKDFENSFNHIQIDYHTNITCEAAYDFSIKKGRSKYIMLLDMGIELETNSIKAAILDAENSLSEVASWELRRTPIEDSKYYDPVTLETLWSSWTAIILRRQHYEFIGGFKQDAEIAQKDIELSHRLRAHGFKVKYCPSATFCQSITALPNFHKKQQLLLDSPSLIFRSLKNIFYNKERDIYTKLCTRGVINCQIDRSTEVNIETSKLAIKPLVSVIMRTTKQRLFNHLRQSILTVVNQTYGNLELIIVEDGSEVHREKCQQLCTNFKLSYRYFSIPKVGRAGAGNYGLTVSLGEYLMFLDDDDYLFADHVETIICNLLNNANAVAGYALSWEGKVDKSAANLRFSDLYIPRNINKEYDFNILKVHNFIPIQSIIFSKRLFNERGGFETELDYLEDWNLWYRYGYNHSFQFIPKVTSIYIVTNNILELIKRNRKFKKAYTCAKQLAENAIRNYM